MSLLLVCAVDVPKIEIRVRVCKINKIILELEMVACLSNHITKCRTISRNVEPRRRLKLMKNKCKINSAIACEKNKKARRAPELGKRNILDAGIVSEKREKVKNEKM